MKKRLALLLAFIMTISAIPYTGVYAAPKQTLTAVAFDVSFTNRLFPAPGATVPSFTSSSPVTDNAYFSWNISGAENNTYELFITLDNNLVGRFILRRDTTTSALVEFQLENGTANPAIFPAGYADAGAVEDIANINNAALKNITEYKIWSPGSGNSGSFIDAADYVVNNNVPSGVPDTRTGSPAGARYPLAVKVADLPENPPTPAVPFNDYTPPYGNDYYGLLREIPYNSATVDPPIFYYPMFNIAPGDGASFMYGGYTVSFLWNNNGTFGVTIDNIKQGYIHDAILSYWDTTLGILPTDADDFTATYKKVFIGFDESSLLIEPYANGPANRLGVGGTVDRTAGDMRNPGDVQADLDISFAVPSEWNWNGRFTQIAPGNSANGDYELPFRIQMSGLGPQRSIDIRLNNLALVAGTAVPADVSSPWLSPPPTFIRTSIDSMSYYTLSIQDLPPSSLFNNVEWGLFRENPVLNTNIVFPVGGVTVKDKNVYTFIRFGVLETGDDYSIWFDPYTNHENQLLGYPGRYELWAAGQPIAEVRANGTEGRLNFPLGLTADTATPTTYYIVFKPEVRANDPITSLNLRFLPTFTPPIGNPRMFKADVVSLKPVSPADDDYAELIIKLSWDIGSVVNIDNYFLTHNSLGEYNAELSADYQMQVALNSQTQNPPFFADVNVRVRTTGAFDVKLGALQSNDAFEVVITDNLFDSTKQEPGFVFDPRMHARLLIAALPTTAPDNTPNWPGLTPYPTAQPGYADDPSSSVAWRLVREQGRYILEAEFIINAARDIEADLSNDYRYLYPGVYFLRTQPRNVTYQAYQGGNVTAPDTDFRPSNYNSITLSDIETNYLSPPQNVKGTNPTINNPDDPTLETSFVLSWQIDAEGFNRYAANRFDYINGSTRAFMNIYITEDQNKFTDFEKTVNYTDRISAANVFPATPDLSAAAFADAYRNGNSNNPPVVYFSTINANTPITANGAEAREGLRNGNIIALTGLELNESFLSAAFISGSIPPANYSLILDGLDVNTKYYFYVDIVLIPGEEDSNKAPIVFDNDTQSAKTSPLSNMATITIQDDLRIPTDEEKRPPAPGNFWYDNVLVNEAQILWNIVPPETGATESGNYIRYEYELIRLKDTQLDPKYRAGVSDFNEIYGSIANNSHPAAMRTVSNDADPDNHRLLLWDGSGFTIDGGSDYIINFSSDPFNFFDKTLHPNSVYYYYIRTVKIIEDSNGNKIGEEMYSEFLDLTFSTSNVQEPENLQLVLDADYDEKSEIVITFDAMCAPDELGKTVNLQYQLRHNKDPWGAPVTMNANRLKASAVEIPDKPGWYNYTYKITGLENGEYQVRVRMVDIITGDASVYTEAVSFTTGFDNQDYDDKWEADSWNSRLRDLLNELLEDPYWIAQNTEQKWEIVYRPLRFPAVVSGTVGQSIVLPTGKAPSGTYYIPASALAQANNGNKSLSVKIGGIEVSIPANAISHQYNDSVIAAAEDINHKKADDYYLRLSVELSDYKEKVHGSEPLTPQITVKADIVSSTMLSTTFDKELSDEFAKYIDDLIENPRTRDLLLENVRSDITDPDFVLFIEGIVDEVKTSFSSAVTKKLTATTTTAYEIERLDKTMAITATDIDPQASVNGYNYKANDWQNVNVTSSGTGRAIRTAELGIYIFAGRIISIPGIEEVKRGGNIGGIAGKYGLDDFLGRNGVIDMNERATRAQVINSIARMAGAPKGSDSAKWLRDNMGMNITARNMESAITSEEAVYLVMSLYEAKTKTKISTIRIRNLGATAGIQGISENYKQYIRAAFELGIYTKADMKPKEGILIRDLLEMLGALDAKVKM